MAVELKTDYVDHICIAVTDITKAEEDYRNNFGWTPAGRYSDTDENIKVVYYKVGPTAIELVQDIDGTGETAKFIKRRGEGIMLVSYHVENCGSALDLLNNNGVKTIDTQPRFTKELNRNFAFIHPKANHGVLTEVIDGKY